MGIYFGFQQKSSKTGINFAAFVAVARHEFEDYCILKDSEIYLDGRDTSWPDWKIIDTMLLYDESDAMREVEISQQGKEYYIPCKTELLRYSDGTYFEPTPQADELRQSILTMELPDERLRPLMLQALEEAETAAKMPKVGRNDLCPCGSGKKYKKCCGR